MDAKDLRTETALGDRSNDGPIKYTQIGTAHPCSSSKTYQDTSFNPLAKLDTPTSRPCAVIGPDRVLPPMTSNEPFLKKGHYEPWTSSDTIYRHPPEYPQKLASHQSPIRNISPRQTYQENMQRIMVPPTYKTHEDPNLILERNSSLNKNNKLNIPTESKYCDVPYSANTVSDNQKSEMCVPNSMRHFPPMWHPSGMNIRPSRPYGAPELYQYPEYASCSVPRSVSMARPQRNMSEETGHLYQEAYYHHGNIRYKPYPNLKERYPPQTRYEYVNNYINPFHPPPPFPTHMPKPVPPNPHNAYPQVPIKYIENRNNEPVIDGYQRTQPINYNVPYQNQIIHPTYGPLVASGLQNKLYPYQSDNSLKHVPSNKSPYDNKFYLEYDNSRNKSYTVPEHFYVNEVNRPHPKSQVMIPNYPPGHVQPLHSHPYYRKDSNAIKNYDYVTHFRHADPTVNLNSHLAKATSEFSNGTAISPSDSNTSNETAHTQGNSLEDCGYASQSSTTSIRSLDLGMTRGIPNEYYRRYNYPYPTMMRNSSLVSKPQLNEINNSTFKDKKGIDVRQFFQMWNEGDEESVASTKDNNQVELKTDRTKLLPEYEGKTQEQLYVLGLVNVPSEELGKYEHIQKVSKLPENIKGYNNIELLKHFEEAIESSNLNSFNSYKSKNFLQKHSLTGLGIPARPVSPLDVEAKISQSVIHKEVGCNFEIKPCSPEMLNVELATPIQNILNERTIEKVSNPYQSPHLNIPTANNTLNCNMLKQDQVIMLNENINAQSCKLTNTQCKNNDTNLGNKTNYSLQDLESNSGVCLASLPRLDNDIELNFPEVNQQFINANKESVIITKDMCITESESSLTNEENKAPKPVKDADKEFNKLSKYRKSKKCEPETKELNSPTIVTNSQHMRTDSVIKKNHIENVKCIEDSLESAFTGNTQDWKQPEKNDIPIENKQFQFHEKAIDFSFNKFENIIESNSQSENCNDHINVDYLQTCEIKKSEYIEQDFSETSNLREGRYDNILHDDRHNHITSTDNENNIINEATITERDTIESEMLNNIKHVQSESDHKSIEVLTEAEKKSPQTCQVLEAGIETNEKQSLLLDQSIRSGSDFDKISASSLLLHSNLNESSQCDINMSNITKIDVHKNSEELHMKTNQSILIDKSDKNESSSLLALTEFASTFLKSSCDNDNNVIKDKEDCKNYNTLEKAAKEILTINKIEQKNIEDMLKEDFEIKSLKKDSTITSNLNKDVNEAESGQNNFINEVNNSQIYGGHEIDRNTENSPTIECPKITDDNNTIDPDCAELKTNLNQVDENGFIKVNNDKQTQQDQQNVLPLDSVASLQKVEDICKILPVQYSELHKSASSSVENDTVSNISYNYSDLVMSQNAENNLQGLEKFRPNYESTEPESLNLKKEQPNNIGDLHGFAQKSAATPIIAATDNNFKELSIDNVTKNKKIQFKKELFSPWIQKLILHKVIGFTKQPNAGFNHTFSLNSNKNYISSINYTVADTNISSISIDKTNNRNTLLIPEDFENQNKLALKIILPENFTKTDDIKHIKTDDFDQSKKITKHEGNVDETSPIGPFENDSSSVLISTSSNDSKDLVSGDILSNSKIESVISTSVEYINEPNTVHVQSGDYLTNKMNITEDTIEISSKAYLHQHKIDFNSCKNVAVSLQNDCSLNESGDNEVRQDTEINLNNVKSHGLLLSNAKSSEDSIHSPIKRRIVLKRSFSDSALNILDNDISDQNKIIKKRRKNDDFITMFDSSVISESVCNNLYNRRNSISSVRDADNLSLCIVIDSNNCIITESDVEENNMCNTEIPEHFNSEVLSCNENVEDNTDILLCPDRPLINENCEYSEPFVVEISDENAIEKSWVDDIGCIETVVSDEITEDFSISGPSSPKDNDEEILENDCDVFSSSIDHTEKVKYIYGDKMCNDDAEFVETLYRTPQMNVNKTLSNRESHDDDDDEDHSKNSGSCSFMNDCDYNDFSSIETKLKHLTQDNCVIISPENENIPKSTEILSELGVNVNGGTIEKTQDDTVNSCESSIDNISPATSDAPSSPEVSSTTSEEKSSGILLKITNYKGMRVSQLHNGNVESKTSTIRNCCKFTENISYTHCNDSSNPRPLITKAAQKYIPPSNELLGDLKVKLPLPEQSLLKLKQLKISKSNSKSVGIQIKEIPKKLKPKFEDVLKSIDEIQYKKHKEKSKKPKNTVPKVVIKKTENGSHYTSISNKKYYNPDLTGRKWQPWVFIEKDKFIDRMAINNKSKAIFNYRKKCYMLAENFKKYKSVSSTKIFISQPISDDLTSSKLKYTIRLKHSY